MKNIVIAKHKAK